MSSSVEGWRRAEGRCSVPLLERLAAVDTPQIGLKSAGVSGTVTVRCLLSTRWLSNYCLPSGCPSLPSPNLIMAASTGKQAGQQLSSRALGC
jgi:hypothetical protein